MYVSNLFDSSHTLTLDIPLPKLGALPLVQRLLLLPHISEPQGEEPDMAGRQRRRARRLWTAVVAAPAPPPPHRAGNGLDSRTGGGSSVQRCCLAGGAAPTFTYHRFWAQADIALAMGSYAELLE